MLNKFMCIGNLGKDPEVFSTKDGKKIVNFSLGISERYKDRVSGEKKERTEWVKIVIFNENLAGIAEKYLKKGNKVYVEGQMQTRKYTDKENIERYTTEIVLNTYGGTLVLLGGNSSDNAGTAKTESGSAVAQEVIDGDEVPF